MTKQAFQKEINECAVVIVGGTSGVGLATALQFVEAGANRIVLVGRNVDRGNSAIATLRAVNSEVSVLFISADANQPLEAERVAAEAHKAMGGLDILVSTTSAAYVPKLLFNTDISEIPNILNQQALAPLLMSRAVLPYMREQKFGVITNVASDAAKVPTPGETILGAAMAAITLFSRTLAIEAKRDGIRVNSITPSLIDGTNVYDRVMDDPFSAKLFSNAAKLAHLGVADPEDLASMIVFLSGPGAKRVTGQTISVNGGISAG
ncbi:SDR family NAD(P)-dependent oxidoreductase [Zhongshania aliphaticivorans]|uniref:SDR family NAD(P)-dependent oxidoreductase n=1 Tax=Zhongshania aliphaticivorans TaxID=1470434 RepID=UPI0012E5D6D7|nr:SDR family oxidoreductase [Zhongshania aliphaticivorans]CAA0096695.1 Glucose 1-dehydrogenase [Zhongshania aliphaticivorans]